MVVGLKKGIVIVTTLLFWGFFAQAEVLVDAAIRGDAAQVVHLFSVDGVDVNQVDRDGETALFMAVAQGNRELVEILVDADANVNHSNKWGLTPLFLAVEFGDPSIVRILINAGAHVNHFNHYGETPLLFVSGSNCPEIFGMLLDAGAYVSPKKKRRYTFLFATAW